MLLPDDLSADDSPKFHKEMMEQKIAHLEQLLEKN